MVAFIPPQVPMPAAEPPSGSEWIHEIKHDGFRTMLAIDNGKARAFTRNRYDWTARYAPVIKACDLLACRSALIGGSSRNHRRSGPSARCKDRSIAKGS